MRRSSAAIIGLIGSLLAAPALAQFGGFFGDPAPRPPASVPGGRQQLPTAAPSVNPGYAQPPGGPYGGVQTQPLPPPPSPAAEPRGQGAQPRGQERGARATPPPTEPPPPSAEQAGIEPPTPHVTNNGALFTGLDKITGRIINFDVAIGETVQFGALQLTPRACYTRPPTEAAKTDAFVEVDEVTLQGEVRRIFTGWMFASSPGLHAVEHPVYDLWLTNCKDPALTASEKPAVEPPVQPGTRAQARPQQQAQQPTQRRPAQQQPPIR